MPADIFVSYAREDEARVEPLCRVLGEQGWSVFWDRRIPVGETWRSYIGRALGEARAVVVVWSQASIESEFVLEEADRAKKRKVLVPVLLDPVDPPLGFGAVQAADLSAWEPGRSSAQLAPLLERIAGLVPRPKRPPPLPAAPPTAAEPPAARPARTARRRVLVPLAVVLAAGSAAVVTVGTRRARTEAVVDGGASAGPAAPPSLDSSPAPSPEVQPAPSREQPRESEGPPQRVTAAESAPERVARPVSKADAEQPSSGITTGSLLRQALLAEELETSGDHASAARAYRKLLSDYQASGLGPERLDETTRRGVAHATILSAEPAFRAFAAMKLKVADSRQLKALLDKKAAKANEVVRIYDAAYALGHPGEGVCAMWKETLLYRQFASDFYEAPVPRELTKPDVADLADSYKVALSEAATPLDKKARDRLAVALKDIKEKGVDNECARAVNADAARTGAQAQ